MTLKQTSVCFIKCFSKQIPFIAISSIFILRMFFMKNKKESQNIMEMCRI